MNNIQPVSAALSTTIPAITADLQQRFINYLDVSPNTFKAYRFGIAKLFRYFLQHGITQPRRNDLRQYRDELKAACKPATMNLYFIAVRKFFAWTEKEKIYPNIAENIKGAKIDRLHHRTGYLSVSQCKALLSFAKQGANGPRDYALILLMLTTGIRCHTASAANIEDIQSAGSGSVLYIQQKGHSGKDQYVKLAPTVESAIREYLNERPATAPADPLFTNDSNHGHGKRIIPQSISRIIKEHLKAAGMNTPFLTAHSLRHTAGTQNILNGGTLEETQELLGHTNPAVTMIYVNAANRERNDSENRLADLFISRDPEETKTALNAD